VEESEGVVMAHEVKDMTGLVIGRLTVLHRAENMGAHAAWMCLCECGTRRAVRGRNLRSGHARSCGCRTRKGKHLASFTPEYRVWGSMKQRCHDSRSPGYRLYGARGIHVCERWRNSFPNFIADMGLRPSPDHSIDRIDNSKGYEPENCRWATRQEQAHNRRTTRYVTVDGVTLNLTDMAKRLGVSVQAVAQKEARRLAKANGLPAIKKSKRGQEPRDHQ
jgi:hypothetical protein